MKKLVKKFKDIDYIYATLVFSTYMSIIALVVSLLVFINL